MPEQLKFSGGSNYTRKYLYKIVPSSNIEEEQNSQEVPARAVCKECRTFVKRADGSTTLMKTHLKNYHPDLYKQYNTMLTKANLEKVKKIQFS